MIETITRERLVALLDAATGRRITVIGDAMLDVYLRGDVERISPEAPVPVVRVTERKLALGGAANVAQNITAIGARCEMVCATGDDAPGVLIRQMLHDVGAETRSIVRVARPTTTKTRVLARSQQLVRYDEEDDANMDGADLESLLAAALSAIEEADAVVFEDYNKGLLIPNIISPVIGRSRKRRIPVVVDPKYRNFFA
jgi:D-glycero-beta-D-manno-heptose-7-phosphate kinase